jgi:hypothetical protein
MLASSCCCCYPAGRKGDDGAESAGMNTDAAGATPEPGTTPEPDDKGDALAALLAAGEQDMSEPEPDNEGRGKSKGKRSRPGSEEQRAEEDEQVCVVCFRREPGWVGIYMLAGWWAGGGGALHCPRCVFCSRGVLSHTCAHVAWLWASLSGV